MTANGYLGEFPVDLPTSPFRGFTPATWALHFIERYGQCDGEHHKAWVLDHVAQVLLGTPVKVVEARWTSHAPEFRVTLGPPSPAYLAWVEDMKGETVDGEQEYSYDQGVAP